ncbi:uncharacterized protein BDZ83DRAFT_372418 [Colletotrichum acutatum]|uniref:Uncharacterized protein n=1 Tax=Glomerella acutata TaxID=27357 RepID=A0AAD9D227_GLOAC|nr:uncharacterized protein BDZ83DRAFT_372418 [Colletotrichum acutatum]KAK1730449.1 hypothetical protein BDZ83DRAFT_372418 [Colletotrichum acutatum]
MSDLFSVASFRTPVAVRYPYSVPLPARLSAHHHPWRFTLHLHFHTSQLRPWTSPSSLEALARLGLATQPGLLALRFANLHIYSPRSPPRLLLSPLHLTSSLYVTSPTSTLFLLLFPRGASHPFSRVAFPLLAFLFLSLVTDIDRQQNLSSLLLVPCPWPFTLALVSLSCIVSLPLHAHAALDHPPLYSIVSPLVRPARVQHFRTTSQAHYQKITHSSRKRPDS